MNKQDENTLKMLKALLSFLEENKTIWQNSEPFSAAVAALKSMVEEIDYLRGITGIDLSGRVDEKNTFRKAVQEGTLALASQIYAMAAAKKDKVLMKEVNFSKSDLDSQRDDELVATCITIIAIARANLTDIAKYNITETGLVALEEQNADYNASITSPRKSVSNRKVQNERLQALIADTKTLLKDQLNRMAINYAKTEPIFYAAYMNTKSVVNYGTRYEKPVAETKAVKP